MIHNQKKLLTGSIAVGLTAATAFAAIPVSEALMKKKAPLQTVTPAEMLSAPAQKANDNPNTYFEDFEARPDGIYGKNQSWLPAGWQDVSKAGHKDVPDDTAWNLTWQVTTNDDVKTCAPANSMSAYDGVAFAFIMCDVAYGDKCQLYDQDEWLISPEITPTGEDWLYFKLCYSPAWTLYNREKNDFSGQNNALEVYISTDGGENWTKEWSLVDEIKAKFTDDELRTNLLVSPSEYSPIYVNIKKYLDKKMKVAFRYFGKAGQPMAIDDVAVGVPMPKSNYLMAPGVFYQGVSPMIDYPKNPTLLIPQQTELYWENISADVLRNEWTYTDASGATVKSDKEHLTTPGYEYLSTAMTPSLQGFFENRESTPFQSKYTMMQAGGFLSGTDSEGYSGEFGVGYTDVFDGSVKMTSEYMSLNPDTDLAWEKIQGYVDASLDVLGFCSVFRKPYVAYGFDYIDIAAMVRETVPETDGLTVTVFPLDKDGMIGEKIGQASLSGAQLPKANTKAYVNLRFNFPVPVMAEESILVVLSGCREGGNVAFPYVKSDNPYKYGNNLVYWIHYDDKIEEGYYEEFKNLGTFPLDGGHFAGFLMSLGASYSHIEITEGAVSDEIDNTTGATVPLKIKALHAPERWRLSADGISADADATIEATYDEAAGVYNANIKVPAGYFTDNQDKELRICTPGSYATVTLRQKMSGIDSAIDDSAAVSVVKEGSKIIVSGVRAGIEVFDVTGKAIASAKASGTTAIDCGSYAPGIYIVRVDGKKSFKVVK